MLNGLGFMKYSISDRGIYPPSFLPDLRFQNLRPSIRLMGIDYFNSKWHVKRHLDFFLRFSHIFCYYCRTSIPYPEGPRWVKTAYQGTRFISLEGFQCNIKVHNISSLGVWMYEFIIFMNDTLPDSMQLLVRTFPEQSFSRSKPIRSSWIWSRFVSAGIQI